MSANEISKDTAEWNFKRYSKQRKEDVMKAFLILEDGTVFEGTSIGSDREVISEIVFKDRKSVV